MAFCARGTTEDYRSGGAQAGMVVGDHELDAAHTTMNRAMLSQVPARLLAEASSLFQLSFRISIASSTAATKFFLIQAYFSLLSYPEGV